MLRFDSPKKASECLKKETLLEHNAGRATKIAGFKTPRAATHKIKNYCALFTCQMVDKGELDEHSDKAQVEQQLQTGKTTSRAVFICKDRGIQPTSTPIDDWLPVHTGTMPGEAMPVTFCYHKDTAKLLDGYDIIPRLVKNGKLVGVSEVYLQPRNTIAITEADAVGAPLCQDCGFELDVPAERHSTREACVRAMAQEAIAKAGQYRLQAIAYEKDKKLEEKEEADDADVEDKRENK